MSVPQKPEGYSSVCPYLVVDGAQRLIDFLTKTFDATELRRYNMPDGSIMHAEVRIDDTVVMIADSGGEWPAFPSWLHVYVKAFGQVRSYLGHLPHERPPYLLVMCA